MKGAKNKLKEKEPIHILLTNDDGIHAEGIRVLSQILHEEHQGIKLSIVAPDRERSAIGHAITMHRPLRVEEVSLLHNSGLRGSAVNGTPSDCVKLAVEALLDDRPDLIISGINRGSNLGTDILYSGTVSAAVEGVMHGIPSMAVSLTEGGKSDDFAYAARFVGKLVRRFFANGLPEATLLNINVPPGGAKVKGARATTLGIRRYRNAFDCRVDPRGMQYYWLAGDVVEDDPEEESSDTRAVREGFISLTPIYFQLTNHEALPALKKILDWPGLLPQ